MKRNIIIHQLKNVDYLFFGYDYMTKHNFPIDLNNYYEVYNFTMESDKKDIDLLNELYTIFQFAKPEGYKGHSLSVSDIIELDGTCHYVDRIGFVKL